MLLAVLVHTESLEVYVSARAELGLDSTWDVDRTLHVQLLHTVLHDVELERNAACDFNRPTERNFTITLGEMEIADAELSALDVDREVDFRATGQILDVAISSMLWATRDRACAFLPDLRLDLIRCAPSVDILRLWWLSDISIHVRACRDQFSFSSVPFVKNLL